MNQPRPSLYLWLDCLIIRLVRLAIYLRHGRTLRPQTCKVCGNVDKMDFTVPDSVWEAVIPPTFQSNVVCLACFDDFAKTQGIEYSHHLKELYFAGYQASLYFTVRSLQ